jgi:hypothetical protein
MRQEESNQEKNKLVMIGNGFDLAHKLDTSYAYFLNRLLEKFQCRLCIQVMSYSSKQGNK